MTPNTLEPHFSFMKRLMGQHRQAPHPAPALTESEK